MQHIMLWRRAHQPPICGFHVVCVLACRGTVLDLIGFALKDFYVTVFRSFLVLWFGTWSGSVVDSWTHYHGLYIIDHYIITHHVIVHSQKSPPFTMVPIHLLQRIRKRYRWGIHC